MSIDWPAGVKKSLWLVGFGDGESGITVEIEPSGLRR